MCGRALGGHMRAHGIGDESGNVDDDDQGSDWEDKFGGQSNKRMYALRTNPNRLKSVRICENCGKEFLSWKSFLEHGKCSSENAESLVSSPSEEEDDLGRRGCGWSKRKRSVRAKVDSFNSICPSSEDEDITVAKCLMELSNARDFSLEAGPEESCASASKEEDKRNPTVTTFLAPLSRAQLPIDKAKGVAKGMFECKACKKVFSSHQALGGHRASHKKVKGCFAARNDQFKETLVDDDVITHEEYYPPKSPSSLHFDQGPATRAGASRRKSKVHRCSICNRIFSSGQALGGHKRCHWLTSNAPETPSFTKYHQFQDNHIKQYRPPQLPTESKPLDLNLPAPVDNMAGVRRDPRNLLSFEVSTEINLQYSWVDVDGEGKDDKLHQSNHFQNLSKYEEENNKYSYNVTMQTMDDEADSKVKLTKLSELKDMNLNGSSSPWLQVGIGSTSDADGEP